LPIPRLALINVAAPAPTPLPTAVLPTPTMTTGTGGPLPTATPPGGPGSTPGPTASPGDGTSPSLAPGTTPSPSPETGASGAPAGAGGTGTGGGTGTSGGANDALPGDQFALPPYEPDSIDALIDASFGGFGDIEWVVPAFVLAVPGLLLIVAIAAQALVSAAWLPFVRRWLGGFGVRRRQRA
jgi:hypothetical protein